MINKIRNSYWSKGLSFLLVYLIVFQVFIPEKSYALTSGPSQPEVQSFEPVSTNQMVDPFSGDFTYNIPLLNIPGPNGGYPINLAYHSGLKMEQEASWVGLGWNINVGSLNRQVRGVADDYDGDRVISKFDMKENYTIGVGATTALELWGGDAMADLNFGIGVQYNSYSGTSMALDVGVNFNENLSMGMSFDSQSGMSISVTPTMTRIYDYSATLSYSNSGLGVSTSLKRTRYDLQNLLHISDDGKLSFELTPTSSSRSMSGGTSTLSFSANQHQPQISFKQNLYSLYFKVNPGFETNGTFAGASFYGNYNQEDILNRDKYVENYAYGYQNLENYDFENNKIMDFSREKDGLVTPASKNIAVPNLTYDIYNYSGQGIGGMFRPYRTDVGKIHDARIYNNVIGGRATLDFGAGSAAKFGVGAGITYGFSLQRPWENSNNKWSDFEFKEQKEIAHPSGYSYKPRERLYFKQRGDKSTIHKDELDYIGGEGPLIAGSTGISGDLQNPLNVKNTRESMSHVQADDYRITRNTVIHKLKNEEIVNLHQGTTISSQAALSDYDNIGEYEVFYYEWDAQNDEVGSSLNHLDRSNRVIRSFFEKGEDGKAGEEELNHQYDISHHTGAYSVLNNQGQRYIYALPAYNKKQVERTFSVDNDGSSDCSNAYTQSDWISGGGDDPKYDYSETDKFFMENIKPPNTYSHLLTSVLGADYVDIDNNGPSDNDYGYWVKFNYVKYADDYQWRHPYNGTLLKRGAASTYEDDKASDVYGEKEKWYLHQIETKTHIAIFELEEREDTKEAKGNNSFDLSYSPVGSNEKSGLRVTKIKLYVKSEYNAQGENATPIKTVHFTYGDDPNYYEGLCGNVPNSLDVNDAKLTLKEVYFTSRNNTRGEENPYIFSYQNNYDYSILNYDRWGNYKPNVDACENEYFPYVQQFQPSTPSESVLYNSTYDIDNWMSAWELSAIDLPSGGRIEVDYEADDYAYVQSEKATQMFNILKVNDETNDDNVLYDEDDHDDVTDKLTRRIYFRLEEEVNTSIYSTDYEQSKFIYDKYVKDIVVDENNDRNLYFKVKSTLREDGGATIDDYVSGYIPLMPKDSLDPVLPFNYGIDPIDHRMGFVTIKMQEKKKDGNGDPVYFENYHPISAAVWQFIKLKNPKILQTPSFANMAGNLQGDDEAKLDAAANLLGFLPQVAQMFQGFRKYCYNKEYGQEIDLNESVIKLCSPDSKKYGGGSRVKKVTVFDNWDDFVSEENAASYGMEYDYTMIENGDTISSGVATYEPLMGGDENALKYPKYFMGKIPFQDNFIMNAEQPYNEDMFPAASVGYRKVTVRSTNTAERMENAPSENIGVTGIKEYEFYTAKDYPIILESSALKKNKMNLPLIIPFIGVDRTKALRAIQSYKIELNDMHGKLKSVSDYALDINYEKIAQPVQSTEYIYKDKLFNYKYTTNHVHVARRLDNEVSTLKDDDGEQSLTFEDRLLGVEFDLITDQRQNKSFVMSAGVDFNVDQNAAPPIPAASVWPNYSKEVNDLKTFASNKVIHKAGVLQKVISFDGQAQLTTENLVFDQKSGMPVLTKVNNKYDQTIYKYDQPAHWYYEGMGAAFENIDLIFEGLVYPSDGSTNVLRANAAPPVADMLVPGDELIFQSKSGACSTTGIYLTVTYLGEDHNDNNSLLFDAQTGNATDNCLSSYFCVGRDPDGSCPFTEPLLCEFKVVRSGKRNLINEKVVSISSELDPTNATNRTSATLSYTSSISGYGKSYTSLELDEVINSSAVNFNDGWEPEYNESTSSTNININPFSAGKSGIWRVNRSYVYNGERSTFTDPEQDNLYEKGVMDDVPIYNSEIRTLTSVFEDWEWFDQNTKYNDESYAIEGKNRLGIYSTALYGYDGILSIGVGSNANYYELGTEDFENYDEGQNYPGFIDNGNLAFGDQAQSVNTKISRTIDFYEGVYDSDKILISVEESQSELATWNIKLNEKVTLHLENLIHSTLSDDVRREYIVGEVTSVSTVGNNTEVEITPISEYPDRINTSTDNKISYFDDGTLLQGTISGINLRSITFNDVSNVDGEVNFTEEYAHTGKKSMKFDFSSSSPVYYLQPKLNLIEDKKYHVSFWIRRENDNVYDYGNVDEFLYIEQEEPGGTYTTVASSSSSIGSFIVSRKIEGWQKVDIEFTAIHDGIVKFNFDPFDGTVDAYYIDDIRISPAQGGIKTFVYDPITYKLRAELNANNYATLYYYDEEDNLYLLKQETVEGIKTLKEVRGHAKPVSN